MLALQYNFCVQKPVFSGNYAKTEVGVYVIKAAQLLMYNFFCIEL
jgi:hypothetical protein